MISSFELAEASICSTTTTLYLNELIDKKKLLTLYPCSTSRGATFFKLYSWKKQPGYFPQVAFKG